MKKNMGQVDRTIRVLAALAVGFLYWRGILSGTVAIVLGVLAVVFVLTSFVSFCPLYVPLGLSTIGKKSG